MCINSRVQNDEELLKRNAANQRLYGEPYRTALEVGKPGWKTDYNRREAGFCLLAI